MVVLSVGKRMAMPARMAGRQAQTIASVASTVDQMVMGTLEKVASIVMPKVRRELRRIMDVRQTLFTEVSTLCWEEMRGRRKGHLQTTYSEHGVDAELFRLA